MKRERRQPTAEEWKALTSPLASPGRRGVRVTPGWLRLRALRDRGKRGKGERMDLSDKAVAHGEAGERTIDRLIEQRHDQRVADERERAAEQAEAAARLLPPRVWELSPPDEPESRNFGRTDLPRLARSHSCHSTYVVPQSSFPFSLPSASLRWIATVLDYPC
jgi:hypothetical protein